MPDSYKGSVLTGCGYTKTQPREWTLQEIKWLKDMLEKGFSIKEIAESMDRTKVSVSIKKKRLDKRNGAYNKEHVIEKYEINNSFLRDIKPKTILDVYSAKGFYDKQIYDVITNDISHEFDTDYHYDALKLLCKMYLDGNKFDLIDLDPFGSAYECLDLAIKMSKKGLAVTLGEMGHKRWRRLDYVRTHYGINNLKDFTIDKIISHIQNIGVQNKKQLEVWNKKEWQNIGRVWFVIKPLKITEQWDNKNGENT